MVPNLYHKKLINAKQKTYLMGDPEPRPRRCYLLPKIHMGSHRADPSSRTVAAKRFDFYLNPLSTRHPSYLKDTWDFIDKIKNIQIPDYALLFTMDIDSLYTNIDIAEGIQAIRKILPKFPESKRPDEDIISLLNINLTRNDFEFNSDFYFQIKGTAKHLHRPTLIFLWRNGKLSPYNLVPKSPYTITDSWMIYGVSGHTRERSLTHFSKFNQPQFIHYIEGNSGCTVGGFSVHHHLQETRIS